MFLKVIQLNCRSFQPNKHFIYHLIDDEDPDIILLNDLGQTHTPVKYFGYTTRQTPTAPHDGVAILARSTLRLQMLTSWTHQHFLAVKIFTDLGPIIFATTYARPNADFPYTDFNKLFDFNYPTYILADLNASHHDFNHTVINAHGRTLSRITRQKNLRFLGPDFYTFFQNNKKGRPDLILANNLTLPHHHHISPGPLSGSDHIPIIFRLSTNPILIPSTPHLDTQRTDWKSFQDTLSSYSFPTQYDNLHFSCLDERAEEIEKTIHDSLTKHTPTVTYTTHRDFTPSTRTQRLITCYRHRFTANKNRLNRVQWDLDILRRHILLSLRDDHNKYWENLVKNTENHRIDNPTKFWNLIKRLKGSTHSPFDYLQVGQHRLTDPQEVTDAFKDHWDRIFHPFPPFNLPDITRHIDNVTRTVTEDSDALQPHTTIALHRLDPDNLLTAPFQHSEVATFLRKTKKRAPGPREIPHIALRALPPNVSLAITRLFNASLACGYFPKPFKTANIRLIPKPNKTNTDPSNYRPISLLSLIGKIFEKLLNYRLRIHLDIHDLIPLHQYAYRQFSSTEDALNTILTYIDCNFRAKRKTLLVTKDIQKAFDTVWHDGLRFKLLRHFQLPPLLIKILSNYLDDRQCRIKHMTNFSDPFTPHSGVPQGSVLAPTLYSMFTHDIPTPRHFDTLLVQYADDLTLLTRSTRLDAMTRRMQDELDRQTDWERRWRVISNPQKTKAIYFSKKTQKPRPLYLHSSLRLTSPPIQLVKATKILGISLDSNLNFRGHIKTQAAIAGTALTTLIRFRSAGEKMKRHIVNAFISPLLSYCPLALSFAAPSSYIKLQKVQNRALRFIKSIKWDDFRTTSSIHEECSKEALNIIHFNRKIKQLENLRDTRPLLIDFFKLIATSQFNRHGHTTLDIDLYIPPLRPIY